MFLTLITHKSLTRFLQLSTGMPYLLTEPMTHKEQLELRAKCRGIRGAISLHPDGKVVIYSQEPVYHQVKFLFPNCYIESEGPLALDTTLYRFQITFIPDREQPCEVVRMSRYG